MQTGSERDLSGTRVISSQRTKFEVLAHSPSEPRGLILDLDDTLYMHPQYREDVARREREIIGEALGWPTAEVTERLAIQRAELAGRLNRPARLTETVLALGLTREWWDKTRNEVYRPEEFIHQDPQIGDMLRSISRTHRVAVASNSPSQVVERVIRILGVDEATRARIEVFGPDSIGVSKPDPGFFLHVASRLGLPPESIISIGDDQQNDGLPAIKAGMGAVLVSGPEQTRQAVDVMLGQESAYQPFNLNDFARGQFRKGEVRVVRMTGRAGAGKATTATKLAQAFEQEGLSYGVLGLDAFFKLSSQGRKDWLAEGKQLGPEEYARRADQSSWWDFGRVEETLDKLRAGQNIHLTGIYNRADKGELTGELRVDVDPRGSVIILEGVAVAHFPKKGDSVVYVNAHPEVRQGRLLGRDAHRAGDAALERFRLTQNFEGNYFPQYVGAIDTVIDNSNGFLMTLPPAVPVL